MKFSLSSVGKAHPLVWLKSSLLIEWLIHFIEIIEPTEYAAILHILDEDYSYMQNVEIIDMATIDNHLSSYFRAQTATSW